MREIDKVIEKGERITWEGKPVVGPFIMHRIVMSFVFLPFLGFLFIPIAMGVFAFGLPPVLFIVPVLLFIGKILLVIGVAYFSYSVTYYALTNRRIVIQRGIIGRDFKIVEFRNLTHVEVNVSSIDKLIGNGSGSMRLHTPGTGGQTSHPLQLESVENPYELFKVVNRKVKPKRGRGFDRY